MTNELHELKNDELHIFWPFLLRGLQDVKRRQKPHWIPEDMYSALRAGQLSCIIPRHAEKNLGFMIYGRQLRPFTFEPEMFIWVAYDRPMREWLDHEQMVETALQCWNYLVNVAKTVYGTEHIVWASKPGRARAWLRKYGSELGWQADWVTLTAKV